MDKFEISWTFTVGCITEVREPNDALHRYVTLYRNPDILVLNILVDELTGECTFNTPNPAEVILNW